MLSDEPRGSGPKIVMLLKLVAENGHPCTLKDIAARAGLGPSTTHRLLRILIQTGLVERGAHQTYCPGRELYRLASLLRSRFDLPVIARPYLQKLWSAWQETTVLCVYNPTGQTGSLVDAIMTPHPLRHAVDIGMELSLPWGSLGRSMLACLPLEQVEAILARSPSAPLSGLPLPSREALHADLAQIRRQGFASYHDSDNDLAGIAAPLLGAGNRLIGCIGVTMPARRFALHDAEEMGAAVRSTTAELNTLLELQG